MVERGKVYVEVYNNSGITGLAGALAAQAIRRRLAGRRVRQLVRHDPRLHRLLPRAAARQPRRMLALDLGIGRVVPAIEPMDLDRLTVILTADAA